MEFNGSKFHPNKQSLTEQELKNWKSLFSNETADIVMARDLIKKRTAEHQGYTVITVWDTDDTEQSISKIGNLIEEKFNAT